MPINAIKVAIVVNPVNQPCPPGGKKFNVTATVAGVAVGGGGSYDVTIYDQDPVADDILDLDNNNAINKNGLFQAVHTFVLECDDNCNVKGVAGNSGETTAEVYAYVDAGGGVNFSSKVVQVSCLSHVPAEDETQTTLRDREQQTIKG
ncbi:MAG: hypothetical protein ACAH95_06990 [Fimbriimonas sp.]